LTLLRAAGQTMPLGASRPRAARAPEQRTPLAAAEGTGILAYAIRHGGAFGTPAAGLTCVARCRMWRLHLTIPSVLLEPRGQRKI